MLNRKSGIREEWISVLRDLGKTRCRLGLWVVRLLYLLFLTNRMIGMVRRKREWKRRGGGRGRTRSRPLRWMSRRKRMWESLRNYERSFPTDQLLSWPRPGKDWRTCLSSYPEFKMIGGNNKLKNRVCLNDYHQLSSSSFPARMQTVQLAEELIRLLASSGLTHDSQASP